MLRLLIDTSVWLDLAADHRQLPIIDALTQMAELDELDLILPVTIIEEFARNKERVIAASKRSLSSQFRVVREAIVKFAPQNERDEALRQLHEVDHRIAVGGEAVNEAVEQIEKLFDKASKIEPTQAVKASAADRAVAKAAPCHRQRNSITDALLIETYIAALAERRDVDDEYGFVTHNTRDFSEEQGDTREPHPDIAAAFDSADSRYATNLAVLLSAYAPDLVEEVRFEREWSQEPRRLSELLEAEHKLFKQVWYNRKWNIIARVEKGDERLVSQDEWNKAAPVERRSMMVKSSWDGMLAAMKRTEKELGPDDSGPWDDFEWGMLNGKLSALRWVMGDEWDMLDT
ncbi:PIN domain-containing protein [Rhizorhapis sp. SPR117]|uniref:PIN domain-containing protein n=1 Tax=Rhizorhapis sp. SPR117 TaxID=2912611 RepID=UPI001F443847|nr:PIN domain-containing protein [Rhizorhapis sp. SPR117]